MPTYWPPKLSGKQTKNNAYQYKRFIIDGVVAKDIILHVSVIGANGASGHMIEYAGSTIRNLSMEGRMTICNMSIEAGGRAGMVEPDQKTFDYLKEESSPKLKDWDLQQDWKTLATEP